MKSCLLVIDVQWGMFQGTRISKVWNHEALLGNILSLIRKARDARVPIVFVQHMGTREDLLAPGTPAFALHPSISPLEEEPVITKRRPNSFHETPLHETLKSRGIGHLYVCGIQTEACVDSTCRAAKDLGYELTLLSDAHSTWPNEVLTAQQIIEHHNATLRDYDYAELRSTVDVSF